MPHSSSKVTSWLGDLLSVFLKLGKKKKKTDSIRVDLKVKRTSL